MIGDVQLRDVAVARDGVDVVTDMNFDIAPGRWLGVFGANGSAKTTLLRAIAGRLPVASGKITIAGVDCTDDRGWRARRIGFAPDGDMLPDALTGAELFDIVTDGRDGLAAEGGLRALAEAFDIERIAPLRIGACSAGMRQRVAIFCAFVGGQRAVILDEPFNWLDPLAAFDARAALRAMVDDGLTLVTALHDLSTLTSSCDCGILMRDGRLALEIDEEAVRTARRDPWAFEKAMIDHLRGRER